MSVSVYNADADLRGALWAILVMEWENGSEQIGFGPFANQREAHRFAKAHVPYTNYTLARLIAPAGPAK